MTEPTQEDREAAADFLEHNHANVREQVYAIRRGLRDDDKLVQLLTRHRLLGAAHERERIVEWLRERPAHSFTRGSLYADVIARGDHHKDTRTKPMTNMANTRIVYSVRGTWWDSIDKVGLSTPDSSGHRIPICPHCGSPLFEIESIEKWWEGVDHYDATHPGYRSMIEWGRGQCFPNMAALEAAYNTIMLARNAIRALTKEPK